MLASFDIGIRHLALCVLGAAAGGPEAVKPEGGEPRIAHWEIIDLGTDNTHEAATAVVAALDARAEPLAGVDTVALESQPSVNPKMKQIATAIQVYFTCRRPDVRVRYVSPRNKLGDLMQACLSQASPSESPPEAAGTVINVDVPNPPESAAAAPRRRTYAENKRLAIEVCERLLQAGGETEWLDFLRSHRKKDDLSDAFLQGRHTLLPPKPRPRAARKRKLSDNRAI